MTYYKANILRPIFKGNHTQGEHTIVYIAIEKKMDDNILNDLFHWDIISVSQIPSYRFAWYILTKPVTNHRDCFNYTESVVIE